MSEKSSKRRSAISRLRELFGQAPHPYGRRRRIRSRRRARCARPEALRTGAERGAGNRPDAAASVLDDVEHIIVENTESHKQAAHAIYLEQLHIYDARLAALNFEERFAIIRQAAPEAVEISERRPPLAAADVRKPERRECPKMTWGPIPPASRIF